MNVRTRVVVGERWWLSSLFVPSSYCNNVIYPGEDPSVILLGDLGHSIRSKNPPRSYPIFIRTRVILLEKNLENLSGRWVAWVKNQKRKEK